MRKIMKKAAVCLLIAALLVGVLASCGARRALDEPIKLVIATDLHYISPSLLGDGSFFSNISDVRNDGKLVHYSPILTDAFLDGVIEQKPQALILSGDLTMNGAKASHSELVDKLLRVKEQGIDVLVIPGNHDVDQVAVSYAGETLERAEAASSYDFAQAYECLIPERAISRDESSLSYIYKASERLWIIMLDTNAYGQCYVKDETLNWLEDQLTIAKKDKIDVISVSHQNIYAHSELLSFGYQLYNADELLALYEKYSVHCNFSGHIHVQSIAGESMPEVTTSSLSVSGLHFGEISYDGKGIEYLAKSVDMGAYIAKNGGVNDENLSDFASYATWYFEEVARSQARSAFAESGLSDDEIELLAETYAKINSAYFEGRRISETEHSTGLALWREQSNSFILRYIESMLSHGESDKRALEVRFK